MSNQVLPGVLVLDIGGTNVKVWRSGVGECEKIPSGRKMTPAKLLGQLEVILDGWQIERVSIGYPAAVHNGRPEQEPFELAPGWVEFDWSKAFRCPMRMMNDACMQALGSYEGGRMLYLGLGTHVGTAFVHDGHVVPLSLGHLLRRDGTELDEVLSRAGLKKAGTKNWRTALLEAAETFKTAFFADYVVIGGGNSKKIEELPAGVRLGGNENAYFGGLRMWDDVPIPAKAPTVPPGLEPDAAPPLSPPLEADAGERF